MHLGNFSGAAADFEGSLEQKPPSLFRKSLEQQLKDARKAKSLISARASRT